VLTIALVASICGAESCVDFADFARDRAALFRDFLELPGGVPSRDTSETPQRTGTAQSRAAQSNELCTELCGHLGFDVMRLVVRTDAGTLNQ
jgi:hypothetical protein